MPDPDEVQMMKKAAQDLMYLNERYREKRLGGGKTPGMAG